MNHEKEQRVYRKLLAVAGSVYLLWWFGVHALLPDAFNPFLSRILVVGAIFLALGLSFVNNWFRDRLRGLFIASMWLITLHYYYLFWGNNGTVDWVIGAYITVIAINFGMLSAGALLSYSILVLALSVLLIVLIPGLRTAVFLPGLFTMIVQANIGLRSRLRLIKILADTNERFELLFNSTFEGVLVHDNRKIVHVNDALAAMLERKKEEIIGADMVTFIEPSSQPGVLAKINQRDSVPYETITHTKSGRLIEIEVRGKNIEFNDRPCRLVTVRDITDRKQAEREQVASMALAESVRARDEFISIASHELRTPLASLGLQVQLIERDIRKNAGAYNPERLKDLIALLKRQTERLNELVSTMLDVSQVSHNRLELHPETVDLSAVVREVVSLHPHENKVTLTMPETLMLKADPTRLKQVLENLLTNAIKYGDRQPIEIRAEETGTDVQIHVKDEGIGIAPDALERIFDRFERAISSKNISGFGLGLYIVRKIVEAHGGSIDVRSELGAGSEFTVRLPSGI